MSLQKCACIETLYTELPFLDRFRAAKTDGFDFVEFWSWEDKELDAVRPAARQEPKPAAMDAAWKYV